MSEEQGWSPGRSESAAANRATSSLTLEQDDGGTATPLADPVSVRLSDTGELPFLQPRSSDVGAETGPGILERFSAIARRPSAVVVGALVAGLIVAAIATQAGRDDRSTGAASPARSTLDDGASDVGESAVGAAVIADGDVQLQSSAVGDGSGERDPAARSSGDAFEADDERVLAVQVIEPAEALTNSPTTTPPTTPAPTTAQVPSTTTTEATTTSAEATTTAEPTTTTTEATTTSAEPTTTTTEEQGDLGDVWVKGLSPGGSDGGNPPTLRPGDIVLQAEGSRGVIAYRFRIEVQKDGRWKRAESSGWRLRPQYDSRFRRYEGRTIRWTVEGRPLIGARTEPTAPLYIYVASDQDGDGGDDD